MAEAEATSPNTGGEEMIDDGEEAETKVSCRIFFI